MSKIWQLKSLDPKLQAELSNALNVHPIIAQLLINRGIDSKEEAENFLCADLKGSHDPFLFKGMDRVVERIKQAKAKGEKVMVFGDYDVDGVTSSALLHKLLSSKGIDVINHIPHRMKDGYGLNEEIGLTAKESGVGLIISVDCGTTAVKEINAINKQGIDVIVIDHHEPSEGPMPEAFAIINPKQEDCGYPFKDLASVGLVSKLVHACEGELNQDDLDMVALGTIADVAPLRGENRILVKHGLPKITKTKNIGLMALLDTAKIRGKKIKPYYVGFILGPRINATGRMDSAHRSLDLFLSKDIDDAYKLAKTLEKFNTERQKMQRDVVQEAMDIVEQEVNFKDQKVIVLSKEGWHKGVLGIVAARITDKYYRPSIVISVKDGVGTASARSISGFHLHEALSDCADCLENFGGHAGAAGLTIKEENIDQFRTRINSVAEKSLNIKELKPILTIDQQIALTDIDLKLAESMEDLEPFGEGNPQPVFCSRNVIAKSYPQVLGKETLKFWVTDGTASISAVGFGMAKYKDMVRPGGKLDLAYEISIDDWNKSPVPQLKLKDIRLAQ